VCCSKNGCGAMACKCVPATLNWNPAKRQQTGAIRDPPGDPASLSVPHESLGAGLQCVRYRRGIGLHHFSTAHICGSVSQLLDVTLFGKSNCTSDVPRKLKSTEVTRDDVRSVGRECHRLHLVPVALEHSELLACLRIPHPHSVVSRA
jgi:hypothetical protein